MNQIDPSSRFTPDAVRRFDAVGAGRGEPAELGAFAKRVAAQYRTDTMSPVMVSGKLRILEFLLLALCGAAAHFLHYDRIGMDWSYVWTSLGGALVAVVLLEIADAYQMAALRRPFAHARRIVLVWSGVFALMALGAFLMKTSHDFSRLWFGNLVSRGARHPVLPASGDGAPHPPVGAQRHDGTPGGDRRRRQGRRDADPLARTAARQRHPHLRHLRRPQRHALAPPSSPAIPSSATCPN
jgi:hypothetical protein